MKVLNCMTTILVVLFVIFHNSGANEARQYTNKYDNVNVDQILSNNRVLSNYIRCLMDEGPCTSEGRELKKTLPDALSRGCDKCNDKQRVTAEKVIKHLMKNRQKDWERLVKKYDPNNDYRKRYEQKSN